MMNKNSKMEPFCNNTIQDDKMLDRFDVFSLLATEHTLQMNGLAVPGHVIQKMSFQGALVACQRGNATATRAWFEQAWSYWLVVSFEETWGWRERWARGKPYVIDFVAKLLEKIVLVAKQKLRSVEEVWARCFLLRGNKASAQLVRECWSIKTVNSHFQRLRIFFRWCEQILDQTSETRSN